MLESEGVDAQTSGIIYVVVVQEVLMYGPGTSVMTPRIGRVLGGFYHRVGCSLTGQKSQGVRDGKWVYTLLEELMEEARLHEVNTYVS